jgi:hypothetical protein
MKGRPVQGGGATQERGEGQEREQRIGQHRQCFLSVRSISFECDGENILAC